MSHEEADFAVVAKFDRRRTAVFEGTEEAVYKWLTLEDRDTTPWVVWDLVAECYETVEEFLARTADQYKPKPSWTEDDIRRIIREELKSFAHTLAEDSESSWSGDIEYGASRVIGHLMRGESNVLPHGWDCRKRTYSLNECTCGLEKA